MHTCVTQRARRGKSDVRDKTRGHKGFKKTKLTWDHVPFSSLDGSAIGNIIVSQRSRVNGRLDAASPLARLMALQAVRYTV